ncbi:MAG: lysylphosphatidylglycerol synthase transmembrane domain-containing protein [bacterium]
MKRWHFWFGVLISLAFIGLALSQIRDWSKFGEAFSRAYHWYLFPVIASYFLVIFLRALRWRYILNQTGRVSVKNATAAMLICYMGNNVFPLRAGEFMRIFLVGKKEDSVSYSESMATVVVERLFDFLVMLIFLAVVLMYISFPEEYARLEGLVHNFGSGTLAGAALILVFLLVLYLRTETVMSILEWALSFLPDAIKEKILAAVRRFAAGLVIMGRPGALLVVLLAGVFIWSVNMLPIWFTGLAFGLDIGVVGCLFLLVVGAAAASIPAAPGFIGVFHSFNQLGLVYIMIAAYGVTVSSEKALAFAVVLHACYYFPLIAAGALAAWREGYSLTKLRQEAKESEEKTEPQGVPSSEE